jgi:hypothetical protein
MTTWSTRVLRKPHRPIVEWKRLAPLGQSECVFGILRSGDWVVDTADGLADLSDEPTLTFAFRLLSMKMVEVRSCLELQLVEMGLDRNLVESFPFVRLVVRAIEWGGYWAEQSFGWLPEVVLRDTERTAIIEALQRIEHNKEFSQSLRHGAMKKRVQLERGMR